jgi:predicted TIM-barrel fold metal-dependent hydrolase
MADLAGEDNLIWASDFPHSDARYPGVVDELLGSVESMSDARAKKLVGANAARIYGIEVQYRGRAARAS